MEVGIRKEQGVLVLTITGRMDSVSAPELDTHVDEQIAGGEISFVVDLSGLDYISSAGLRSMLTMAKKLKEKAGTLKLCGLKGVVREVFDVSGFSTIFTIYDSLEDAL